MRLTHRVTTIRSCAMTTVQERKQQERLARRRRIQRAARDVFAEKGYAKTSIEQVARRATLSVGAIYLYFRSKEDLYVSLMEEALERFDRDLTALAHTPSGLSGAWSYLVDWARENVEETRMLRLMSQPGIRKQLSDEVASAASAGFERIRDHFRTMIGGGVESGKYRSVDINRTADVLWSLFLGTLQTVDVRGNLDIDGPSFIDAATSAFSAIESGLRTHSSRVAEAA